MTLVKKKFTLAALTVLTAFGLSACETTSSAKGPEWKSLTLPENIAQVMLIQYDQNSIGKHAANKNWRSVNILTQAADPNMKLGENISSSLSSLTADCENKGMRLEKIVLFSERDGQGEVVQSADLPSGEQFAPVKEQIDEELFALVCKK